MSFDKIKVFALIPARKKSSGVRDKNIYKIQGKSLIDFTLEAAVAAINIDQIFVSSDSKEILRHTSKFQDIFPIKRPSKLATNKSSAVDVVTHFLEYINVWPNRKTRRFLYNISSTYISIKRFKYNK